MKNGAGEIRSITEQKMMQKMDLCYSHLKSLRLNSKDPQHCGGEYNKCDTKICSGCGIRYASQLAVLSQKALRLNRAQKPNCKKSGGHKEKEHFLAIRTLIKMERA